MEGSNKLSFNVKKMFYTPYFKLYMTHRTIDAYKPKTHNKDEMS